MSKIKRAFSMFLSVAMIATSIYVPNPVAVYAEEEESIMTGGSEEQVEMPAGEDTSLSGEDYELPGVEEDTEDDSSEFENQIESEEVDVSTVEEDVNIIPDLDNVEEEEEEEQEEASRSFDDEEETLGAFPALQNQGIIEDFDEFVMTDYVSTSNPQVALKDITDYKGKIRYVQDTEVAIATDPVIQFSNKGTKIASKSYKGYARLTAGIGLEAFTFVTGGDDGTADKSATVSVVAKALSSDGDTLLLYDENSNPVDSAQVSQSGAVYELTAPAYGKYYLGTREANSNIYNIKVELNSPKLYELTVAGEGVTAVFYDENEDEMASTGNVAHVERGSKVYIEKQSTYGKNTSSVATDVDGVTVTELDVDYYSVTMPAQNMMVTFTLEPGQYELTYPASVKEVLAGGTSIVSGTTPVTYNSVLSVRVTKLPEKTAHLYMSYEDADGNYVNKREVALTEDASTEDPSYTASINMPGSKTALSVTYDDVPYDPYEISGTGFTVTGGSDATHAYKDTVVTVVPDAVTDESVVSGVTYSYTDSESHEITYYAQQVGSSQNYQFKMPAYNVTVTLIRSYPINYSATGVTRYTSNVTATPNVFRYNSTDYVKPGANVTITVKDEESDLTLGLTVGGEAYSTGIVITQPTSTQPTGTITIDSMPASAVTVTMTGTSYVPVTFENSTGVTFSVRNAAGERVTVNNDVISRTFKAGDQFTVYGVSTHIA